MKTLKKEDSHNHKVKRKTDMKNILEKKPLILRNNLKIPTYPKFNPNLTIS